MPKEKSVSKSTKISSKPVSEIEKAVVEEKTAIKTFKFQKNKFSKIAIYIFAILIIGALLYKYKGFFVVATVNGKPISRIELIKELEKQGGKQALDSIITKKLILQAAKNKNITISQSEIDAEIAKIEETLTSQNTTLEEALSLQGLTRNELVEQIVLQKSLETLVSEKTVVTDEEVAKYLEDNKDNLPADSNLEDLKAQVKDFLAGQKFSTEVQNWITDIKTGSSIKYFVKELRSDN
ncbi:MAG: SurA N-terminal domain-containing protein [bacterium]